jgi:subtilisin
VAAGEPPPATPGRPAWSRESTVVRLDRSPDLHDLSREWAWGGATGRGIRVAVIDSGIEADHPAVGGRVDVDAGVEVLVDPDGEATILPGPHDDAFGHGTACASIIHKIAPDATIVSVRVLGARLSGSSPGFLAGLRWAVEQRFDVINLSLGATKRDWALAFHDVCDQAYFSGSLLVTAANNVQRVTFPSLFAAVTSVACNTADDPFRFHWNPDPPTEFLAPGIEVETAWRDGGTTVGTGNSYAAPHIAGIAALVKSKHPELRPFQLKTVLWATSVNVMDAVRRGDPAAVRVPEAPGRVTRVLQSLPENRRKTMFVRPV